MSILSYPQTFRKYSVNIPMVDYLYSTNVFILVLWTWGCTDISSVVPGYLLVVASKAHR